MSRGYLVKRTRIGRGMTQQAIADKGNIHIVNLVVDLIVTPSA